MSEPPPTAGPRLGLVVAGMHRSGTSAVARLCSLLGAALPASLVAAGPHNVTGHWEPASIVALNDRLLAARGSTWNDWRRLALSAAEQADAAARTAVSIEDEYGNAPLFVLKDPRICRLFPVYADALAAREIAARVIIPLRHPLAVAASLGRRDGTAPDFALLVWLRHLLEIESATRDTVRCFVSCDRLFADWSGTAAHIADSLGFTWPRTFDAAAAEVEGFLTPNLLHDPPDTAPLTDWFADAYRALLQLEDDPAHRAAPATLDRIRAEFDAAAARLGDAAFAELAVRDHRLHAARTAERTAATAVAEREGRIARLEHHLRRLTAELSARRPALARYRVQRLAITATAGGADLGLPGAPPLEPGHYALHMAGEHTTALLHVECGYDTFRLPLARGGTTRLSLYDGALGLRIEADPLPERVTLRRVSRLEYYAAAVLQLVRAYHARGALRPAAGRAIRLLLRHGPGRFAAAIRATVDALDAPDESGGDLRAALAGLDHKPLIAVLMPVHDPSESVLCAAIDSVRAQLYDNWELCIADDASRSPRVRAILADYAARDPRIRVVYRETNGHICAASNTALAEVTAEWVALLDHDDVLAPAALAELALEVHRHPEAELIYTDEDKLGADGRHFDAYRKPDFSRELFRSQNYLNHLTAYRTATVRALGGWRPGYEGGQHYDLNLRIFERVGARAIRHIPRVLYHWRATSGSTALALAEKDYAYAACRRALQDHVRRTGLRARVEDAAGASFYRLRFALPEPPPLVSLIVPTRDRRDLIEPCIASIRARTSYPNYEIVVIDNASTDPAAVAYLETLQHTGAARVLAYGGAFNFSAISNFGVAHARGTIVGLVNNDIEVISPGWLAEMVSWAAQPDVGCVGAKLYYPDDTVQHAGVVLLRQGIAGHAHLRLPRAAPGYFGRAAILNNYSAVTAACLLVRKTVYESVGGFNADDLPVAFNDVDFCLRVREAGYDNVWTPYAELYHHESASRGRDQSPERRAQSLQEVGYMQRRWQAVLAADPFRLPRAFV